jgi:hypothetical protein
VFQFRGLKGRAIIALRYFQWGPDRNAAAANEINIRA